MQRNTVVIAVVSLIVGAFMVTMLPVQAHHNDRALKSRVRTLEAQVADLESLMANCFYYQGMSRFTGYRSVSGGEITALDLDASASRQFLGLFINDDAGCITARRMISGAAKLPGARTR